MCRPFSTWRTLFPRFPCAVDPLYLACPCAAPISRCLARRQLAALLPCSDAVRSLAPVSRWPDARCAAPSIRRRSFSCSGVLPVRRSLRRSVAPTPCVPPFKCLGRPPPAVLFPRYDAVHSLAPVSCSSAVHSLESRVRPLLYRPDALIVLPNDQTLKESASRYMELLKTSSNTERMPRRRRTSAPVLLCFVSMKGCGSVGRGQLGIDLWGAGFMLCLVCVNVFVGLRREAYSSVPGSACGVLGV